LVPGGRAHKNQGAHDGLLNLYAATSRSGRPIAKAHYRIVARY
jgi:hypothetical protein